MTTRTLIPTQTETEAYREFLSQHMSSGLSELAPDEVVRVFRMYASECERFVCEARRSIDRGSQPNAIDVAAIKRRVASWIDDLNAGCDWW